VKTHWLQRRIDYIDMQRTMIGSALIGERLWGLVEGTWLEDVFWHAVLASPVILMVMFVWAIYDFERWLLG
jgi:hypothetical protein